MNNVVSKMVEWSINNEENLILQHIGDYEFIIKNKDNLRIDIYPDKKEYFYKEIKILTITNLSISEINQPQCKYIIHNQMPIEG